MLIWRLKPACRQLYTLRSLQPAGFHLIGSSLRCCTGPFGVGSAQVLLSKGAVVAGGGRSTFTLGLQHFGLDFSAGFGRRRLHLVEQVRVEGFGRSSHGSQGGNSNNSGGNQV